MSETTEVEQILAELKDARAKRYALSDQIMDLYNRKSLMEREAHDLETKIHQLESKLSNAIADEARAEYESAKPVGGVG